MDKNLSALLSDQTSDYIHADIFIFAYLTGLKNIVKEFKLFEKFYYGKFKYKCVSNLVFFYLLKETYCAFIIFFIFHI